MKYLCLVYHDPPHPEDPSRPDRTALVAEAPAYDDDLLRGGHYLAGHTLEAACVAAVVRVREGRLFLDDIPCAPAHAQLGGFYLIEARDLNDAIRLASRNPGARLGHIEVRPIKEAVPR